MHRNEQLCLSDLFKRFLDDSKGFMKEKKIKVCVADIQKEKGNQFVEEMREVHGAQNVTFVTCDVSKEADYKNIFEQTLKQFQQIDVVVNNAGIANEHDAKKTINVNLMGPILGCQLAIQFMGKSQGGRGGIVINTASVLGFLPHDGLPIYCAAKHGVIGLTRSYGLPYHLEKEGILFSALCPSYTDTEILNTENTLRKGFDKTKITLMSPDYVAQGVLKLLDDKINGATLVASKAVGFQYVGLQEVFKDFQP